MSVNDNDHDNVFENDNNNTSRGCSVHTTTVLTQSKNDCLRNEVSFRMRNKSWTINGWRACVFETISIGLMLAGIVFVGTHGRDLVSSVASRAFTRHD
jgi:hypothetical protein